METVVEVIRYVIMAAACAFAWIVRREWKHLEDRFRRIDHRASKLDEKLERMIRSAITPKDLSFLQAQMDISIEKSERRARHDARNEMQAAVAKLEQKWEDDNKWIRDRLDRLDRG